MMGNKRHLSMRIEDDMLKKFHYVCDYDGRSANAQMLQFVRRYIASFEEEHGEIVIDGGHGESDV